jgi:hypothetical protein
MLNRTISDVTIGSRIILYGTNKTTRVLSVKQIVSVHDSRNMVVKVVGKTTLISLGPGVDWDIIPKSINFDIDEGDKVIILKKTNTHVPGDEAQILGFVEGDKNRIIIDGIFPGGWISRVNVKKKIDPSQYRLLTLDELVYMTTFDFVIQSSHYSLDQLGKPLSEIEIAYDVDGMSFNETGNQIPEWWIVPRDREVKPYFLRIKTLKELRSMGFEDKYHPWMKQASKKLDELDPYVTPTFVIKEATKTAGRSVPTGVGLIPMVGLEVTLAEDIKEEKKEAVQESVDF